MPALLVRRTLLTSTKEHMTDGILKRRADQIAFRLGAASCQFDKGSVPNGNPWVFRFYKKDEPGTEPFLILEVRGTRGMVYTALGNYLAGVDYAKS